MRKKLTYEKKYLIHEKTKFDPRGKSLKQKEKKMTQLVRSHEYGIHENKIPTRFRRLVKSL